MKNISTKALFILIITCCLSLLSFSQQDKNNKLFDFKVLEYSNKPDAASEHLHLISLKNNSNKVANYIIISKTLKGKTINGKMPKSTSIENNTDLLIEVYNESLNKKIEEITLAPNESIKIYVKVIQNNSAELGKWNSSEIVAQLMNKNNIKTIEKSVIIESFIPDPTIRGH